jgi:hypothetical protein
MRVGRSNWMGKPVERMKPRRRRCSLAAVMAS